MIGQQKKITEQEKRINIIKNDIVELTNDGRVSTSEMIAILDAILNVWAKAEGKAVEKDLCEGVMLSTPPYDKIALGEDKVDIARYLALFPKALIKGVKLDEENTESMLSNLIGKTIDFAVENGYKESENITTFNTATYKANMQKFEEEKEAGFAMIETVRAQRGEDAVKLVKTYLLGLATGMIARQREYFLSNIDKIVKMHANIELVRAEEERNASEKEVC